MSEREDDSYTQECHVVRECEPSLGMQKEADQHISLYCARGAYLRNG